jgi:WD40 repeat protein
MVLISPLAPTTKQCVWDAANGEAIATLQGHVNQVTSVAFWLDGLHIISGSYDRRVRVWDTKTGKATTVPCLHERWIRSVSVSSDGSYIIFRTSDGKVRTWPYSVADELNRPAYRGDFLFECNAEKGWIFLLDLENSLSVRLCWVPPA